MAIVNTLENGKRAQRKTLITVAEWGGTWGESGAYTGGKREILGTRTEDSSIEFNADIATSTDILGITYTDVNKTEPQQSFDPFYLLGGSELGAYLTEAALKNDIQAYNGAFNIYVIAAYLTDGTSTTSDGKYYAVRHKNCSIVPTSMGGDSYVSMPIECHYSNDIVEGTVDVLKSTFVFTEKTE